MFLETQIEELDEQISHLLHQVNQVITTIPGIGDTLGSIIVSEIGDINRFDAPNKLVAFAGLDVKVSQSGKFTGTKKKISKRGSPYLRRVFGLLLRERRSAIQFCLSTTSLLKPEGSTI